MDKFCIDCRHYQKEFGKIKPMCDRYVTYTISPVKGMIPHYETCEQAREPGGRCGPEGFGWKRPTIFMKIFKIFE